MQKVTEIQKISLNYDQEGHGQKHKDYHVYWKTQLMENKVLECEQQEFSVRDVACKLFQH